MKKVLTIVFIFAFVSGCGFKKINDPNLKFYSIGDIKLSGNKQLGLVIQNKLKLSSSTGSKNTLFIPTDASKPACDVTVKELLDTD